LISSAFYNISQRFDDIVGAGTLGVDALHSNAQHPQLFADRMPGQVLSVALAGAQLRRLA